MVGFGFSVPKWHTVPFYESRAIGRLPRDNADFNPDLWKPRVPNQAFLHARADDKFWAAQKLVALTTDMIRAAVRTGEFGDPAAEEFLVRALAERRDAIRRAYLTAVNPIAEPALDAAGILTFKNAAVDADVARMPQRIPAAWSTFDNTTHEAKLIGETSAATPQIQAPAGLPRYEGAFVKVELSAIGSEYARVGETGERLLPPRPERLEPGRFRTDGGITGIRKSRVTILLGSFPPGGSFDVRDETARHCDNDCAHRVGSPPWRRTPEPFLALFSIRADSPSPTRRSRSPAQPLPSGRTVQSGANGLYQFQYLTPGDYVVEIDVAGVGRSTRAAIVEVGRDTQVDFILGVSLQEEVTVSASPIVDMRSAEVGFNFRDDTLNSLPLERTYRGMFQLIPGVPDNRSPIGPAAGGSRQDNLYLIDGANITSPAFGYLSTEINELDIAEVNIKRGGISAEFGRTAGTVVNAVSRSGSNRFSGMGRVDWLPESMVGAYELPDDLAAAGVQPGAFRDPLLTTEMMPAGGIGGPILQNRLFFYASARHSRETKWDRVNKVGTPLPDEVRTGPEFFGKLNYRSGPAAPVDRQLSSSTQPRRKRRNRRRFCADGGVTDRQRQRSRHRRVGELHRQRSVRSTCATSP